MIIFIRNLVVKDLWLKLFSLALAVLIWLTVDFSMNKDVSPWSAIIGRTADESVMTVPVLVPSDTRVVSFTPDSIRVTLRGDPKLLQELTPGDVRAQVNLNGIESANGLLRPVEVILPPGVAYTRLAPEEVEVRVSHKNQ